MGGGLDVSNTGTESYFNDTWEWSKPGQAGGDQWVRQVMVRDNVFYATPTGGNGTQCRTSLANESIVLCGSTNAYPGQASCGLTGVSTTPACPLP